MKIPTQKGRALMQMYSVVPLTKRELQKGCKSIKESTISHLIPMTLRPSSLAICNKLSALDGWQPNLMPSSHCTLKLLGGRIRRTSLESEKLVVPNDENIGTRFIIWVVLKKSYLGKANLNYIQIYKK